MNSSQHVRLRDVTPGTCQQALVLHRGVSFPCSSPSTQMTKQSISSNLQLTPLSLGSLGIQNGDESVYRQEVDKLVRWCSQHNLQLNTLKTVEMVVDFRKPPTVLSPLTISNSPVSNVDSFKFLGSIISQDLKLESNINTIH